MKNNSTELVFILDRSGSMAGLESDTVGGFNAMIQKQREQAGECYVSTFLFDNRPEIVHDRKLLDDVGKMTGENYVVRGCTALLDALGEAITHIGNIHKYARPEDVPSHTVFVITTDGMENASHRYSAEQVRGMIRHQKETFGWEFIFLAANIDAVETARGVGIDEDRAVNYLADSEGTACLYQTVSKAVCSIRQGEGVKENWSMPLKADCKKRKK